MDASSSSTDTGSPTSRLETPITEDTVFRIASLTKLFTAIAVMQLVEQGRVDLDGPANDYLRAYKLVPAEAGLAAGDAAPPAHPHGRDPRRAPASPTCSTPA